MQRRNWKEVERDNGNPQFTAPYAASMNPKGTIYISHRTWENMNEPEAFLVLWDQTNSCIGLKPTPKTSRNAYAVGRTYAKWREQKPVRCARLVRENGIVLPDTIRFQHPEPDQDG